MRIAGRDRCGAGRERRWSSRGRAIWLDESEESLWRAAAIEIDPDRIGRASVRVLSIELEAAQEGPPLDWLEASLR
jgi:hypothetical protein